MWQLINKNKYPVIIYILLLVSAAILFILEGKAGSFYLVSGYHSVFCDWVFRIMTFFGNGIFMMIMGLVFVFFYSIRNGLIIFSSFISSALIVQFLKRFIFEDHLRPVLFFANIGQEIYRINGLEYHSYFSFPSGHSATAFALFMGFALFSRNNILKLVFILLACIIAYSRVYLSQHFLEDIIAGSLLGILAVLCSHYLFSKWNVTWADKSIIKIKSPRNVQT